MTDVMKNKTLDVCIVATLGSRLMSDFAGMIQAELATLGLLTKIVADGNAQIGNAKAVILLGEAGFFPTTIDILKSKGANAPVSILWHTEQLPLSGLSPQAEITADKLVRYYDKTSGLFRKGAAAVLPFRNHFRNIVLNRLAAKLRREIQATAGPIDEYDFHVRGLIEISRPYISLKRLSGLNIPQYIFVTTWGRKDFLDSKGIKSHLLPVGWHEEWGYALERQRDIDVVFLGHIKDGKRTRANRLRIVNETAAELKKRGYALQIVEQFCYGKERTELLNRTKVVLDVARVPWDLPGMRLIMSMACGALIVTSYVGNPYPFTAGQHLIQSPSHSLAASIAYYLEHEDQRKAITIRASQHLEKMKLHIQLKKIIQTAGLSQLLEPKREYV
jgi:hypothetical protein